MKVFNDLTTRGVNDILSALTACRCISPLRGLIAVTDGLTGMPAALAAVFPRTTLQTCIVHLIRNSLDYPSWKDRKPLAAALRPIYAAATAERQARWHTRRRVAPPPLAIKPSRPARRSRSKRWNDALAELTAVQAECAAWFDALPKSLRDSATATALQDMIELDLDAIAAVQPPLGYGRD
jgi:Transposase, Mutator family